jgi:hypothetical protein
LKIPWGEREEDLDPLKLEQILDLHALESSNPHSHEIWGVGCGNRPRGRGEAAGEKEAQLKTE